MRGSLVSFAASLICCAVCTAVIMRAGDGDGQAGLLALRFGHGAAGFPCLDDVDRLRRDVDIALGGNHVAADLPVVLAGEQE